MILAFTLLCTWSSIRMWREEIRRWLDKSILIGKVATRLIILISTKLLMLWSTMACGILWCSIVTRMRKSLHSSIPLSRSPKLIRKLALLLIWTFFSRHSLSMQLWQVCQDSWILTSMISERNTYMILNSQLKTLWVPCTTIQKIIFGNLHIWWLSIATSPSFLGKLFFQREVMTSVCFLTIKTLSCTSIPSPSTLSAALILFGERLSISLGITLLPHSPLSWAQILHCLWVWVGEILREHWRLHVHPPISLLFFVSFGESWSNLGAWTCYSWSLVLLDS